MENHIVAKKIVHAIDYNMLSVNVVWLEYSGGGMDYEFEVIDLVGKSLHLSADGYGSALPAAAGAYDWLVDNNEH